MKPFKSIPQIFIKRPKAADVHVMLIAFSIAYMDEIVQSVSPKLEDKAKLLNQLGFTNADEIRQKESEESRYNEYKALCVYKEIFPDSIFLKVDDFKKVLEKYGLVSGLASQYTGTIPDDCLDLIHKAQIIASNNHDEFFSSGYKFINQIYPYNEECIPFCKHLISKYKNFPFIKEITYNMLVENIDNGTFLIAATPDKMKNTLTVVESRINSDPIVFQLLPYDIVVIHAKWGNEANDDSFTSKIL